MNEYIALPVSLRDYFAAAVIQGQIAKLGLGDAQYDVEKAYIYADLMLKERLKGQN